MATFFDKLSAKNEKYRAKYRDSERFAALKIIAFALGSLFRVGKKSFFRERKKSRLAKDNVRVAFYINGGLGDLLASLHYIKNFGIAFRDDVKIRLFTEPKSLDIVKNLMFGHPPIEQSCGFARFEKCAADVRIIIRRRPSPAFTDASVLKRRPKLAAYIEKMEKLSASESPVLSNPFPYDYIATKADMLRGHRRNNQPDFDGTLAMDKIPFEIFDRPDARISPPYKELCSCRYFTIQRGSQNFADETKIMSLEKYRELVSLIKKCLPTFAIVQLGRADTVRIDGIDVDLRGKTNFDELKLILRNSAIHIDCECGMVHLKHYLGGKSLVFFGPTPAEFMGYRENINIVGKGCGEFCEWLSPDWQKRCMFDGGRTAKCLDSIDIAKAVETLAASFSANVRALGFRR